MSGGTGMENMTWVGTPTGPVDSFYLRIRNQNLCSHRDYQNVAVNGARSGSMADKIVQTMARNHSLDHPVLLSFVLIGNDVCSPHHGIDHMTTPQEFETNVLRSLDYLDANLPPKSHVSFMGLIDGRILYETMAQRLHPIGELHGDVTYARFYDYLNCLESSPCWGWMNSNADDRNKTTARAFELNKVYAKIMAQRKYKNFDMMYTDPPLYGVIEIWKKHGGQVWQLIEPVDGFHPNQVANALFTEFQWQLYQKKYPYLIPPVNPHNAQIKKIFGDQGGH